jgi:hypothetical protein
MAKIPSEQILRFEDFEKREIDRVKSVSAPRAEMLAEEKCSEDALVNEDDEKRNQVSDQHKDNHRRAGDFRRLSIVVVAHRANPRIRVSRQFPASARRRD